MKAARDNKAGTASALMIFCVFTMSVLTVLTLGVNAYKNVTDISREGYDERVSLSYVWTKIKNGDEAGMVSVRDFQGLSALCIDEEYDGATYHTLIYHYDGWIYELFFEEELEFSPEDGIPVIKNKSLSFEQPYDGLIKASAGSESIFVSLRAQMKIAYAAGGNGQ